MKEIMTETNQIKLSNIDYTQFETLADHLIFLTHHKVKNTITLETEIFKIALKRLVDLMNNDHQKVADLLKVGKNVIIGWLNNGYKPSNSISDELTEKCNKIHAQQSQIIFTGRGCKGKMLKDL